MKIPEAVKVGPLTFKIQFSEHVVDGSESLFGQVLLSDQVIRISTAYSQERQEESFWHEALHAMSHVFDIELKESHVKKLATALLLFVKENGIIS